MKYVTSDSNEFEQITLYEDLDAFYLYRSEFWYAEEYPQGVLCFKKDNLPDELLIYLIECDEKRPKWEHVKLLWKLTTYEENEV